MIDFLIGSNKQRGQLIVEILVAIALLAVAVASAATVIFGGQKMTLSSERATEALSLARQSLEQATAVARGDFTGLVSSTSTNNGYTTLVTVTDVSATRKDVKVNVSWQADSINTEQVSLSSSVANWQGPSQTGGDTGGGGLTGDWSHPKTLGSVDLGPGEQATGLDVINKIVYMTAQAASQSKPDFFVVNATDGTHPSVIANLDTGPGLLSVDVAGTYAYVGNNSQTAQLQIIDVSNPSNPNLVNSFRLPGVTGSGAIGNTVFYNSNKIYIGTRRATGPEFFVIDVSNPLGPVSLGSYEVNADVNSIKVVGTTAYLATSDDNQEIMILNVADAAHISLQGSYNASSGDDGQSLFLTGSKLYLGRSSGASDFIIADTSNPVFPATLGSYNLGGSSVNGIVVRDYLAFVGTSQSNNELQIWNISDPAHAVLWSSFNFPQVTTGLDYENNLVYASVRSNDGLRIITSQ